MVKICCPVNKIFAGIRRAWAGEKKSYGSSRHQSYASLRQEMQGEHRGHGGARLRFESSTSWGDRGFVHCVTQGYQKNAIAFRCINIIAQSLSAVRLELHGPEGKIYDHPLLDTLKTPNAYHNYASFIEACMKFLYISGNVFIQATRHGIKDVIALHVLRPDRMKVLTDGHGALCGYAYHVGGQREVFEVDPHTGRSAILHIKLFNPLDEHWGMSPILAAQSMIELQNVIADHNLALLKNAGCPSGALILKGEHLQPQERAELQDSLRQLQGRGYGQTILLDGNFEWQSMGISPKDMDFAQGRSWAAREIAQVFGIPPMCVGLLGDSTYANYQEARLHLWEDTLLPALDGFVGHLNHWLTPLFGSDLHLSYNKDQIHALISRREKLSEHVGQMAVLTINEKREMLGYGPLAGGNVLAYSSESWALERQNNRLDPDGSRHQHALQGDPAISEVALPAAALDHNVLTDADTVHGMPSVHRLTG